MYSIQRKIHRVAGKEDAAKIYDLRDDPRGEPRKISREFRRACLRDSIVCNLLYRNAERALRFRVRVRVDIDDVCARQI